MLNYIENILIKWEKFYENEAGNGTVHINNATAHVTENYAFVTPCARVTVAAVNILSHLDF